MTDDMTPPREDLYRAMPGGATSSDGRSITVRLAPAEEWAEIHSEYEGHFMERFSRSAYRKTMAEHKPKILFQHGKDPQIGDKPIATTDEVGEDETSPFARGELLDGVPELVVDGLRKGVYGASHRFSVKREKFVRKGEPGYVGNPKNLPERTITEAQLYELGPVTWPAYAQASVALRSMTDEMRGITPTEPVAPSDDAAAPEPHLEPERRDEAPPITEAIQPKESPKLDISQYRSIEEMVARRRELTEQLKRDAEVPGILPENLQAEHDEAVAERAKLDEAIAAWRKRIDEVGERAEDPKKVEGYAPVNSFVRKTEADIYDLEAVYRGSRNPDQYGQALRDNAMRAAEIAAYPIEKSAAAEQVQRFLDTIDAPTPANPNHELARRILATGSPLYRRAFNKYVTGQPLTPEESRGTALAVQVDGTGGYALPFAFDPTIIPIGSHSGWQNPYRQFARVETIVGTDTWQGLTSTAVVATRADEAAAATEQGPTFAQPSALVTRVQGAVTYSIEMGQDRPDIGSELAMLIGEAKDNEEEAIFSTGVGDALGQKTNPIGIFAAHGTSGAYTHVNLATAHTLAIGDLDALEAAVPVRFRGNAVWLMSERILRSIQGLETTGGRLFDGTNGYPSVGSVQFTQTGNTGKRLLNKPVYITPSATYDVTVDDTPLAWLGDPRSYLIVDRAGINVEYIPHVFADAAGSLPTGQRRLYFWYRNTAKPINTDAGRILMVLNA